MNRYTLVLLALAPFACAQAPQPGKPQPAPGNPPPPAAPGAGQQAPATNATVQRPGPPGQPPGGKKGDELRAPTIKLTFEKADPLAAANYPKCELKQPNSATYIGFQFGPTKRDVVYCCFDADDPKDIHERCWWFVVGTNATPVAKVENSKALQVHAARGVKVAKEKPREFELPVLRSKFGDVEVMYKITLTYGLEQKHLLHVSTLTQFRDADGKSLCTFQGQLAEEIAPVPNEIKVIPLIEMPVIENYIYTRANPPWVRPYLRAGKSFIMSPGNGMDEAFEVVIRQKPDPLAKVEPARPGATATRADGPKIVEKMKLAVKLREHSRPGESGDGLPIQLKGLKAGQTYDVETQIDLGPFGTLKGAATVAVPGKIKT